MLNVKNLRGEKRNHNFMMTGQGKAATRSGGGRSTHDIGERAVMLDKIEVCGRKIGERITEIAHDRDGFQKNLRQNDRRA